MAQGSNSNVFNDPDSIVLIAKIDQGRYVDTSSCCLIAMMKYAETLLVIEHVHEQR